MSRPQIRTVIFDVDGLLLDSERIYTIASNEWLRPYGKTMTWETKVKLMGRPAPESARIFLEELGIEGVTPDELVTQMGQIQAELFKKTVPLPGAVKLVQHLHKHKIPIAIATGSKQFNFVAKSSHLPELFGCFPEDSIVTADTPQVRRGKPHPDIFLYAASTLGVTEPRDIERCLVFEDGIPGVIAAKAAKMSVVWVPEPEVLKLSDNDKMEHDQLLKSLEDFDPAEWGLPPYEQ
ncbi:uncharacterized protein L969DRAFT_86633 [Mixia osmundae IAM 14324]|uniref:Uncharacterized protein n=1 Tax=Mixia osmundae (strain CBS 9802 / IAM 14324 / JCM 22182 / KY 12970) TaxID=764103 RepID=G7E9S6_MIXOS|nr:uncharacterized protein L969DRAFT_86633 [Mixia osmundae IAM 14324]KEI40027.1 hypothetical protein L969DRAFT_86633 [Mixia osmundae IAM 14324]GAA99395.1 hypothetical protein E5Q_06092 [Mixia osmundae IAM 14324]